MANLEACIFDLDGVIVETNEFHFKSWKRLSDTLNIPFTEDDNEKMKGISRMDSLDVILEIGNVEKTLDERKSLAHQKNEWYKEYLNELTERNILPGVSTLIRALKLADIKIAVGSASKNARLVLDKINLTKEFDAIVDGNDVAKSKPDPEVFLKAADILSSSPSNTIVFEDSYKGLVAANEGKFYSIGVGDADNLHNANMVISSFDGFTLANLRELYATSFQS